MKKEKSLSPTTKDSEEIKGKKTILDYSGEELDKMKEEDPEGESSLWDEAELDAINDDENHDKSL